MPKSRKPRAKPSFGVPDSETQPKTGWVYRSDAEPEPAPEAGQRPAASAAPGARPAPPAAEPAGPLARALDWISRPIAVALVMVLSSLGHHDSAGARPPRPL